MEIPEDVFDIAYEIADGNQSEDEKVRLIAAAILAERLAERERDAKIADELWKVRAASNLSPTEAARLSSAANAGEAMILMEKAKRQICFGDD